MSNRFCRLGGKPNDRSGHIANATPHSSSTHELYSTPRDPTEAAKPLAQI
jgi:hypothetical protein